MPLNFDAFDKLLHKSSKNNNEKMKKKIRRKIKEVLISDTIIDNKSILKKNKEQKDVTKKDMNGSLFRFINEKLSFSNSAETEEFFKNDPTAFEIYHKGFGNQRDKWPEDPMDWVIKQIIKLPRRKFAIVADFGCGDGRLSKMIGDKVAKFYNYDFVSTDESITSCDIANVPLENESVDAVVISLALMGTNCCEYLAEANRILKINGSLILVELVSRVAKPSSFIKKIGRIGFIKAGSDGNDDKIKKTDYFMKLHWTKSGPCDRENLPDLLLKPVLYKKR